MFSGSAKPYTAITAQINSLTSEQYEADDMSGIPDLIEVIRIQAGGPTEAARAIRKKLVAQQLRALTILDGLMENAGPRFQRSFVDEPLLERLRVAATDSLSDPEVRQKCQILTRQWAVAYKGTQGMERIVALEKQLPKRKRPPTQQQSKVLRETKPTPNEDPFETVEDEGPQPSSSSSHAQPPLITHAHNAPVMSSFASFSRKSKSDKASKHKKGSRTFNLEKEKPHILQSIASSSIASTNLLNALRLIDREHKRVSEDSHTVAQFESCKQLRRQILRYIQHIENEQWLGSLIHANDGLVEALMAFEILDKSVEDDSDSDDGIGTNDHETAVAPLKPARPGARESLDQRMTSMNLGKMPESLYAKSQMPGVADVDDGSEGSGSGIEDVDEDDPFADTNELSTPKLEHSGMTWKGK